MHRGARGARSKPRASDHTLLKFQFQNRKVAAIERIKFFWIAPGLWASADLPHKNDDDGKMASALENAIGETKAVLQPLFAKPKLSTKLLSKPPFRFIHDIIVTTIKSTGFPTGFFGLEELDSSNFKDSKAGEATARYQLNGACGLTSSSPSPSKNFVPEQNHSPR